MYIDLYPRPMKSKNRRWIKKKCQRKRILRPGFGIPEALFTIFYTALGPVLVDMMPRRQNMNGRTYGRKILPRVFTGLQNQKPGRPVSRWHLHHDNASPHKTALVKKVLEGARIHILEHAPYSPNLAPCDFFLFPKLKSRLAGRNFKTRVAQIGRAHV